MKNITYAFFRRSVLILAAGAVLLVFLLLSGCGRREAEFLKAAEQEALQQEEGPLSGNTDEEKAPEILISHEGEASVEETLYIDVCGAVVNPGVYELEAGSRVFQALEAAGGILPEAAGEYVNRAGRLEDGQQIYIPTREEAEKELSLQNPAEQALSGRNTASGNTDGDAARTQGRVNLNTADEAALTTLTGIGASKAQAILAYREEHGGFSAIEEILNVPGIKEGTFVKIKDNIAVE